MALPLIGAEAVLLGMQLFKANAKSVNLQLADIARSAFYLERSSRGAFAGAGASWGGLAVAAGSAAAVITAAAVAAVGAAVALGTRYAQAVEFVGAISESSTEQTQELSNAQLELSRVSTQTATQLNSASAELVKAGFEIEQVTGGVLRAVNDLVLASGGELEAAKAATLMQVAFQAFHTDVVTAANAATAAVQRSTLTFNGFADAMRQGGNVAANVGLSINEFSAVVGSMGKTITSGTEIGTGLRVMFQRLQAPTKDGAALMRKYEISLYDAAGASRPFLDVLRGLEEAFGPAAITAGRLTEAQRDYALATLFGARAVKTVTALLNQGTKGYLEMLAATNQLSASDVANRVLLPTAAVLQTIANNVAAVGIAFSQGLDPYINEAATAALNFLRSLDLDQIRAIANNVGRNLYNAFANLGNIIQTGVLPAGKAWLDMARAWIEVTLDIGLAIYDLSVRVAKAVDEIVTAVVGPLIDAHFAAMADIKTALDAIWNSWVATWTQIEGAINNVIEGVANWVRSLDDMFGKQIESEAAYVKSSIDIFVALENAFNAVARSWASAWTDMTGILGRALGWILGKLNGFLDELSKLPILGEFVEGTRAAIQGVVTGIPRFTASVSSAVQQFATDTGTAFSRFGTRTRAVLDDLGKVSFKLHDFAAAAKEANDARRRFTEGLKKPGVFLPDDADTEAGFLPDEDDLAKALKKLEDAIERAQELIRDFNDDVQKETRKVADAIAKLFDDAVREINEAMAQAEEDIIKTMSDSGKAIADMFEQRNIQADIDRRRDALEDSIRVEERAREQQLDDEAARRARDREDEERSLDFKREMLVKGLEDRLALEERTRKLSREDEDRTFEASQEALEQQLEDSQGILERQLQDEQEIRERQLQERLDAEERTLQAEQDARERALKDQQDIAERALQDRLDVEKRAFEQARDLEELVAEDARKRAEAQSDYNEEIARGVKQSIAQTRLSEALKEIEKDTAEQRAKLTESQAGEEEEAEFDLTQRAQLDALAAEQRAALDALEAEFEAQDLAQQAEHNKQKLALDAQHEKEVSDQSAEFERARVKLEEELEIAARARSRAREEEDRIFEEQQAATLRAYVAKLDAEELQRRRIQEDDDARRRRKQEAEDLEIRTQNERKRETLSKQIDDEEFDRRKTNIETEAQERIANIEMALAFQQKETQRVLDEELQSLRDNLDERITEIRTRYLDRLEDILREGGAKLQPVVDEITGHIARGLESIRDAAREAVEELQKVLGVRNELDTGMPAGSSGEAGRDWWSDKNFALGMGMSEEEAEAYANNLGGSKQYGGIVPGRFGESVPIMAHGGERFEGIGAYNTALTAVRAAESMYRAGIGTPQSATNYSYTVNANYGQVQPEGSVKRDLSAMIQLTK